MLLRPFAPFRMRPLRSSGATRKIVTPDLIAELAEQSLPLIKGSRSPLKSSSRLGKVSLRVLKNGDGGLR